MTRKIYTDLDATGRTITAATFSGNATSATTATSATSATSATNATNATNINISTTDGNTSDTTLYPVFVAANTTGNQAPHTDVAGITYNASTNALTATTFSGALSGNASTATSAATWTTARLLGGNSVNGSADVDFANKFIVQGTTDTGLSGAQFLGALGTGIVKNTTTTGVLSIAVAADFPTLNQNTTGSAGSVANSLVIKADSGAVEGTSLYTYNGSASKTINFVSGTNVTIAETAGTFTFSSTDTNYYPTDVTMTAGTTAGPVVGLTMNTGTVTGAAIPVAAAGASGVVSTTTQTFDGAKTFSGNVTVTGQVIANGNIGPNGSNPLTIYTANQSSTTVSQNIIMRSGNQTGTAVSGNVTVTTGTTAAAATGAMTIGTGAATGGNSGNVSILTGTTTTSGNSGTVHINVGVAQGTAGAINIGTAGVTNSGAPSAITLGTSAITVAIPGRADVGGGYGSTGTTIWDTGGVSTDGALITGGALQRTALNDGITTSTATINTTGQFIRTTSSARYKQDITPANFAYEDVLALEPKVYRLKYDMETFGHAREHAGFIAEDVDQIDGMKVFVNYTHDDNGALIPDGLNYDKMVSALVSAIKHQDGLIKQQNVVIESLTARIEALEA